MTALSEIEAVYRRRFPVFLRVAVAIVGEEELARDGVQEAFVRAVRHARGFRGEGPLEAWLWRIVVNEARKQRRRAVVLPRGRATDLEPTSNGTDGGAAVRALVAALPERQRLALFLRYYADLDYDAIAAALGVTSGTVGATLNAAHRRLREQLQEVEA